MLRRTKIVTTLGPATDSGQVLENIIRAGANMVRINFSHGCAEDHRQRVRQVREIAARLDTHIAVLGDLQGPKIRLARFACGSVQLQPDARFTLDAELASDAGDEQQVGLDYKALPGDVAVDDLLLLDDGRVQLLVEAIDGSRIHTRVRVPGTLSNNKGINKLGGGLSAPALTAKDRADIVLAAELAVDYLAVSFPRTAEDMQQARELARAAGLQALLMAKIERAEVVASEEAMDAMILAADAVMVARGDLGVEIGDAELVGVQKRLIRRARQLNRVVITATQMMESMIESPMPTRADVMDVANAVLDGTDAVMLSAETATGHYPVETVRTMAGVCLGAEKHPSINVSRHRMDKQFSSVNEAIAMATMYAANHMQGVKAIVSLTESGRTPLLLSRISSGLPIFALSRHPQTLARTALYRGVCPLRFDFDDADIMAVATRVCCELKNRDYLRSGDLILLTYGDDHGAAGATNTCKLLVVD